MKDVFILNFNQSYHDLPISQNEWQKEIINFIQYYQNNKKISVQTSGSTGTPKNYDIPKPAMQQSAMLTADFLQLKKGDSALLCLPIHYIAGKMMVVRAIEIGMELICVEPKTQIQYKGEIDFAAMTPMQAEKSLDNLKQNLKIKKLILGGAKVSENLEQCLNNVATEIFETYGMTETITHIAMRKLNQQKAFHTLKNIEISVTDEQCLSIQTPYFKDKIFTNDVVELIDNQKFIIKGRKDNIINSGGLKINPEELEDKLKPFISKSFIIHSKSDATLGQKLVLIIESNQPIKIDYPQDLIQKNKQPKEIFYINEFPRTISGKIQRKKIDISMMNKIL